MDQLVRFCVHLLESLFFIGVLGSCAVVLLSLVADVRELFHKDEPV